MLIALGTCIALPDAFRLAMMIPIIMAGDGSRPPALTQRFPPPNPQGPLPGRAPGLLPSMPARLVVWSMAYAIALRQ